MVQQFLRSGQAITPSTNARACRCGSTLAKPATRPTLICGASPGARQCRRSWRFRRDRGGRGPASRQESVPSSLAVTGGCGTLVQVRADVARHGAQVICEFAQRGQTGLLSKGGAGAVAKNGALVVAQSSTGKLFRVDPATGTAEELDLGDTPPLSNANGLELPGHLLYVVRNDNVVTLVRLESQLASGVVLGDISGELDTPSTATVVAGRL
jgi:hypothetical protein